MTTLYLSNVIYVQKKQTIYISAVMTAMAGEYTRRESVMQLHYGFRQDNHPRMFRAMQPDTGFDRGATIRRTARTAAFLAHWRIPEPGIAAVRTEYGQNGHNTAGYGEVCRKALNPAGLFRYTVNEDTESME